MGALPQFLRAHRVAVANVGLVVVLIVSSSYLFVQIMRINPLRSTFDVTVHIGASGGLFPNNDVTYRGYRVGRVRSVELSTVGVVAIAEIDSNAKIPVSGKVAVQRLSAAGEQYIDFRPDSDAGPFLADGAIVESSRVTTPTSIQSVLANTSGLIDGLNPERLNVIVDQLDKALAGGPDQLRNVVSGMSAALAGLTTYLPQTTQLITNLQTIAGTTSQIQPDLSTLTQSSRVLFDQLNAADQEVAHLLDSGPGHVAELGSVLTQVTDPATRLLTNILSITAAAKLRTPAMRALFPSLRDGLGAIAIAFHDNELHTFLDIWPRPTCEYETIPVSPTNVGDGRTRLYNYCITNNPALQIRGSANAPRPLTADDGSGPPPGADPNQLSMPIPGR